MLGIAVSRAGRIFVEGNPYGKGLPKGTYAAIDGVHLARLVLNHGEDWSVFLSGSIPILAVSAGGVIIHSLHRLDAWRECGRPLEPDAISLAAGSVARRLSEVQEELGLRPGTGLTRAVVGLAPEIMRIRRHKGADIMHRAETVRGGRVDILRTHTSERIKAWDMRSAYAGVYRHGIPGDALPRGRKVPASGDMFFARCRVSIPHGKGVPIAPYRRKTDGRLLFPTGEWDTWLCGPEFRLLEAAGEIERVYEVHPYSTSDALAPLVEKVWPARKVARDWVAKSYCKLLLVSGYGALAAHGEYPVLRINPASPVNGEVIRPGVVRSWVSPRAPTAHTPAAAWILSAVRARLAPYISLPGACYCAVDSVVLPAETEMPEDTGEPGGWSLKYEATGGEFKAQGMYSLGGGAVLRAIGVESHVASEFLSGKAVSVTRTASPLSSLECGEELSGVVELHMRSDTFLGRVALPDGSTRPLTVREIESPEKEVAE